MIHFVLGPRLFQGRTVHLPPCNHAFVTTPFSVCISGCSEVPRSKFQLRESSHVAQDHCRTRPKSWEVYQTQLTRNKNEGWRNGFFKTQDPWEKQMTQQNYYIDGSKENAKKTWNERICHFMHSLWIVVV